MVSLFILLGRLLRLKLGEAVGLVLARSLCGNCLLLGSVTLRFLLCGVVFEYGASPVLRLLARGVSFVIAIALTLFLEE